MTAPTGPPKRNEAASGRTVRVVLAARQERVAALLAAGWKVAAAAREVGAGKTTVWAWLRQEDFRKRIDELRRELLDAAIGKLADLMAGKAVAVLSERLDLREPKTGRPLATLDDVKAAFELFVHTTNAAELKARIEVIEAAQRQAKR